MVQVIFSILRIIQLSAFKNRQKRSLLYLLQKKTTTALKNLHGITAHTHVSDFNLNSSGWGFSTQFSIVRILFENNKSLHDGRVGDVLLGGQLGALAVSE